MSGAASVGVSIGAQNWTPIPVKEAKTGRHFTPFVEHRDFGVRGKLRKDWDGKVHPVLALLRKTSATLPDPNRTVPQNWSEMTKAC